MKSNSDAYTRLSQQTLTRNISHIRRTYLSLSAALSDFPSTTLLINATGLGSLTLSDVKDASMVLWLILFPISEPFLTIYHKYPTRGQTILIAEPKIPIKRMYLRAPQRLSQEPTYIFPRPYGGGVILGGCRQDGDWNEEVDMKMARGIMERCCKLASELGEVDDLQVISYNVGLRREYFLSLCFGSELS